MRFLQSLVPGLILCIIFTPSQSSDIEVKLDESFILTFEKVNVTYDAPFVLYFYNQYSIPIASFKWHKNVIGIEDCQDTSLEPSSPLYVQPKSVEDGEQYPSSIEADISFYRADSRFLARINDDTLLIVNNSNTEICDGLISTRNEINYILYEYDGDISYKVESAECDSGYYLNNTLNCEECTPNTCTPSNVNSSTLVNYKGFYIYNEETSILHLKVIFNTALYASLYVTFYDINRNIISSFIWGYENTVTLENCKTVSIQPDSPYYFEGYSSTYEIYQFTFYKSSSRFLVTESGSVFFAANRSTACTTNCDDFFDAKIRYVGFSYDERMKYFYTEPLNCKAGYYMNSTLSCGKCPANTYSPNKDMECKPCPIVATAPEGSSSLYDCKLISCQAGHYLSVDGTCMLCPNGTYSVEGQVVCTPCPVGTTSLEGSTNKKQCKECDMGTFLNALNGICEPCPNGTFSGDKNHTMCYPCLPGQTSNMGSSYYEDCYWKCQPGEVIRGEGCLQCPQNTFSPGNGARNCRKCPKGRFSPAGSSSKKDCKKDEEEEEEKPKVKRKKERNVKLEVEVSGEQI